MSKYLPKKYSYVLLFILALGIFIRFINFRESLYFGYDEARDAYVSQDIFLQGDLKLLGPQASAFSGIHHGPIYYYLIGPLFILGKGDPYFVSIFFRLLNALGIIGIFFVGSLLYTPAVGLISSLIFALSYEQYIYAIFTGNPSISNLSWILMFIGAGIIQRIKNRKFIGLTLLLLGAAIIPQFDMILGYSLLVLIIILSILRKNLKSLSKKQIALSLFIGLSPLYTYLLAELKYKFLATKTLLKIIFGNVSITSPNNNTYNIFIQNLLGLFRDNIIDFHISNSLIALLLAALFYYLVKKSHNNQSHLFLITWILSFSILILARGFMPFYSYAGVGIGLIIAISLVVNNIYKLNKSIALAIVLFIAISNLTKIYYQSNKSLIVEIKAQPGMKLSDEIVLINKTYQYANFKPFTIRVTSMPYRIQTVWAYLYQQYGFSKYSYLPFLETGNVEGYPGYLPPTKTGTTCVRYLIIEPLRGIPLNLVSADESEEDLFSTTTKEEKIGEFILQTRQSKSKDCY